MQQLYIKKKADLNRLRICYHLCNYCLWHQDMSLLCAISSLFYRFSFRVKLLHTLFPTDLMHTFLAQICSLSKTLLLANNDFFFYLQDLFSKFDKFCSCSLFCCILCKHIINGKYLIIISSF